MVRDLTAPISMIDAVQVLDFGCADQPYRDLLPPTAVYIGADLLGNARADVILLPDGTVPQADEAFDLILSTQVLEHVPEPGAYLSECFRLLKPGGSLVLSTHGIMYYHRDPEDYWRWTMPGLVCLVEEHGFKVVQRRGVLGLAGAALQLLQDAKYWSLRPALRPPFALVMQSLIRVADRRQSDAAREDNGLVIAVRATRPPLAT